MPAKLNKQNLGRFNQHVEQHKRARSEYPRRVFGLIKKYLKVKKPLILDLGCGTGISTRQLVRIGEVVGCDIDAVMLKHARLNKAKNIKYVLGAAEKLPFKDKSFDAVTAFAAFHWFDNKKALSEIKRVLKPRGLFFIIGKSGHNSWGQGYRDTIQKVIKRDIAQFPFLGVNPHRSLLKAGFVKVKTKKWPGSELFSVQKALDYVQSVSIWNSVPKRFRQKALLGLTDYFRRMRKTKGRIERKLTVYFTVGKKSADF